MIFSRNRGSLQFLEALPLHSAHNHRLLLGPYSGIPMLPHLGTPEQPAGPPPDVPTPQDIHAKSPNEKRPSDPEILLPLSPIGLLPLELCTELGDVYNQPMDISSPLWGTHVCI
jgi:hypothetical protein